MVKYYECSVNKNTLAPIFQPPTAFVKVILLLWVREGEYNQECLALADLPDSNLSFSYTVVFKLLFKCFLPVKHGTVNICLVLTP